MTDHDLSRRKILGGIVTIGAAGAAAGAGTMAYFSDTETSSGNTIQAGTMDLSGGISSTSISTTSLAPGESESQSFSVTNSGSVAGDHVEFDVTFTENDNTSPGEYTTDVIPMNTALALEISDLTYDNTDYSTPTNRAELPGAFINDVTDIDVPASNADAPIHITSEDGSGTFHTTVDYNYIEVDVSSQAPSVSDVRGSGNLTYEWDTGGNSSVGLPDEVFVILDDGRTLARHKSGGDSSGWNTRDVGDELTSSTDWVWVSDGSPADPTSTSGTVAAIAIGVGNVYGGSWGNRVAHSFDSYFDTLDVNGTTYNFQMGSSSTWTFPQPNLQDLDGDGSLITLDGLTNPGADGDTNSMSLEFTLDSDVGNAYQGDGVDIDLDFALAQQSGQNILPK